MSDARGRARYRHEKKRVWMPVDADAFVTRTLEAFPGSYELDALGVPKPPRPSAGVPVPKQLTIDE